MVSVFRAFIWTTLLIFCVWIVGFFCFLHDMHSLKIPKPPPLQKVDAIVVLTGGSNRLKAGLSLLKENAADKLLLSGVNKSVGKKDLLLHESLPVDLGYQAHSTIDNAYEARAWLKSEKAHSFFLVTAHYHMRRSLLEFHQRLHQKIIPYPVVPESFIEVSLWNNSSLVTLVATEYNKYIVALCRAMLRSLARIFGLIN